MKEAELKRGRTKQKLQTRAEILNAAKALMKKQKKISLDDVAKKAKISRATMYRYFSNIDLLFTEASIDIHHKSSDEIVEEVNELSMEERILHIQKHYNELAQKNEVVFRRYLSAVLTESIVSKKPLRGARRMDTLQKALRPYRTELDNDTFTKLVTVSSLLMGIDSLIICKDVCKLDNEETELTLKWAVEMILKGISSSGSKA
jgi:AcrR family transcriptional regulator